jgi:serine/threonine protein kinase/Flp pilus assembly protein TadD
MKLEEGTVLGSYSIRELLGSGGMGEVYRATDTRLKRDVAIKVVRKRLAENSEALARFEREAQSIAALSHPNILAIHDVGSDAGISYLVMELLEGESLRARMERTNLSTRKAVEIARQIVGGLVAAHDRGIVHRDLKPENVFLTREGLVKILDFGLAKQGVVPFSHDSETAAPTFGHSEPGMVMGTLAYMSPEQVRGQPVDHLTDVFSLGVMLYEMLSGQKPYLGHSSADVISAILKEEPRDISEIDSTIPLAVRRIVNRCLEKNLNDRFQTARDLAFALETAADIGNEELTSNAIAIQPAVDDASSSVAVIPFTNMSPDPEQEYFCEGMAEEIINSLAAVEGLRVAARSSAFQFNSKSHDAREVGAALNVKTVLEGSVRTAGRRVRVTVQLIDVDNGFQLWSERYDREMDDIFALQDEISEQVVDALKVTLGAEAIEDLKRPTAASVEAYQLYLKGLHNWYRREKDSLVKAASLFEQAAAEDPSYALAHAGVVSAYASLGLYGFDPSEARAKSGVAIERALTLEPELAEVRAAVGLKSTFLDWDWQRSEQEFKGAIEANPSFVLAYCWYSFMLAWNERSDEAVGMANRAVELDPLSPYTNASLGLVFLAAGRHEEAVGALNEALDIDSNNLLAIWLLTAASGAMGRFDEAVALAERAAVLTERAGFYLGWLGWAYGIAGQRDLAQQIAEELVSGPEGEYIRPLNLVQVYSGLGDIDQAFVWIDRALEVRDPLLCFNTLPYYAPLRKDPRFEAVRRAVGN